MSWLVFLPILVALAFVIAHVARGGRLTVRRPARPLAIGLVAVLALAAAGIFAATALKT